MTLKNSLYILATIFFLNGCTHQLVNTKQLEAIDARLAYLEENLSQEISKNISHSITKELDIKLTQHDENLKSSLEASFLEQNENFHYLSSEISALIKAESMAKVKTEVAKQTPVKVEKKVTTHKEKLVVGSVEKIRVYPSDLVMDARIDTGAETSSIDARDITEFERDGKNWVRFTLVDRKTNTPHVIERKVVRTVKIMQSSMEQGHEKRLVVTLKITIGNKKELSEFTITNREHMQFPILIGRNALQDVIMVDVSNQYMAPLISEQEENFKK